MSGIPAASLAADLTPAKDAGSPSVPAAASRTLPFGVFVAGALATLLWAYWPTLVEITQKWSDPQYSHGYLVPVFAVALLLYRAMPSRAQPKNPSSSPVDQSLLVALQTGLRARIAAFRPSAWGLVLLTG